MAHRRAWFAGDCVLSVTLAFAACGIDESGLLATSDGSTVDVTLTEAGGDAPASDGAPNDGGPADAPAPTCDSGLMLDTSCLGTAIPAGWQPVLYAGDSGCGTDFTETPVMSDASAVSCTCSTCGVTGSWSCTAELWTGPVCPGVTTFEDASACWSQNGFHFGGDITRSGSPSCSAGTQLDGSVTPSASVCSPKTCTADFCGHVDAGFGGCIWNPTTPLAACPAGFTAVTHVLSATASAQCTCPSCALANVGAPCTGGLTSYAGTGCTGLVVATTALDGGCQYTSTTGYNSMYYDAGPPPSPDCQPTGPATGTPVLDAPHNVCCVN